MVCPSDRIGHRSSPRAVHSFMAHIEQNIGLSSNAYRPQKLSILTGCIVVALSTFALEIQASPGCEGVDEGSWRYYDQELEHPTPDRTRGLAGVTTIPAKTQYICDHRDESPILYARELKILDRQEVEVPDLESFDFVQQARYVIRGENGLILDHLIGSDREDSPHLNSALYASHEVVSVERYESVALHRFEYPNLSCLGPLKNSEEGTLLHLTLQRTDREVEARKSYARFIEIKDEPLPPPPAKPELEDFPIVLYGACGGHGARIFIPTAGADHALWYRWKIVDRKTDEVVFERSGPEPHMESGYPNIRIGGEYRIYIEAGDHLGQLSTPQELDFTLERTAWGLELLAYALLILLLFGYLLFYVGPHAAIAYYLWRRMQPEDAVGGPRSFLKIYVTTAGILILVTVALRFMPVDFGFAIIPAASVIAAAWLAVMGWWLRGKA